MARKGAQRAAKLVPAMRYRNVAAAAEWLCTAFGFETHRLVKGDDGAIAVAQLTVGPTMIMLLPVGGSELDHLMKQPDEIGGAETQKCYLVVDDIDIHYAKAKAGGAQFVLDLKEYENGGRGFSCRDPEGHIWSFGTYDPWDGKSVVGSQPPAAEPMARGRRSRVATMAAMVAIAVAVGAGGWMLGTLQQTVPSAAEETRLKTAEETRLKQEVAAAQLRAKQAADRAAHEGAERSRERSEREAVVRAAQQAREELARGASAKEAAERAARQLEAQLTEERRAKEAAERAAKTAADQAARQLEAQLAEERRAKEAAERTAKTATDQIAKERTAKQAAQNATSVVQRELALARAARQVAEKSAKEATEQLARERAAREAAERVAREAQVKSSQAQGAEKGTTQPANPDRSSKKVSKKSGDPGAAGPMPPLLP